VQAAQPLSWATVAMGRAQVAASTWGREFWPNPAQYCATFIPFFEFQFSKLNYRNSYRILKFIENRIKLRKIYNKFH
jgi:hypothetical protein